MAATRRFQLMLLPLFFGAVGFVFGVVIQHKTPLGFSRTKTVEREYPLPHHIPKYPGNLTLRFAMVHDVIHERFPHHSPQYYRARNREVEKALKRSPPTAKTRETQDYFRLIDDLGVGLSRLGQHQQAAEVLRDKLKRQEALGYQGRELYSTYANLGTLLILWQLSEGVQDVPKAKERIGESVSWIRKAIDVYPQSHFGREIWQLVLEEFLLDVLDKPDLLLEFDMIGDRLDANVQHERAKCFDEQGWLPPRSRLLTFLHPAESAEAFLKTPSPTTDTGQFRKFITPVGAEKGWKGAAKTSQPEPVPFDEPALGIVGMWRMGAGANPHFALALGEIMLRVGQRYIAWTAYERADRMRGHYWPDPRIRERFGRHCRDRQTLIEQSMPGEAWHAVRARFEQELAHGQDYQRAYQDYEAKRIAAGASPDDPDFYQAFDEQHGSIATPVGAEDKTSVKERMKAGSIEWPWPLFCAGLFALFVAIAETRR